MSPFRRFFFIYAGIIGAGAVAVVIYLGVTSAHPVNWIANIAVALAAAAIGGFLAARMLTRRDDSSRAWKEFRNNID